jgi:ABC-type branched-subunit amino acid transport system substrate-binding protein
MMLRRRAVAAVGLMLLLAGACTATTGESATGGTGTGTSEADSTTGVTDDSITVSLVYADLSILSEQNLAPEIGDAGKTAQAVVDDINAKGGVGGRKIILKNHVLSGVAGITSPDVGRQACVQATEDDKPFAVVVGAALPASMVQCLGVDHDPLTITMAGWPDSLYQAMGGRLFSVASHTSASQERLYSALPKAVDGQYPLAGKKVGIIRMDTADQKEAADTALKPALSELGVSVAAESVLPCPEGSTTCEQHDVAIQRMRDAGVDTVFLLAQTLAGSATVEAAQKVGYKPQWITMDQNVTDTVAQFYKNASDSFNGALGLGTAFKDFTPAADECNRIAVAGGAESFPVGSDGYGFTAVTCLQITTLVDAIAKVDGPLTQRAVISALESIASPTMAVDPAGSLSAEKHDAGNAAFLARYSAADGKFIRIGNSAIILDSSGS